MSEQKVYLEKIHIKNYLSLRNVELPFKPLTVLVGPNASGKTNVLNAMRLFNRMILAETPPTVKVIENRLWAGKTDNITFLLHANIKKQQVLYELKIEAAAENSFSYEKLMVNDIQIISVQNGLGSICDENGENETIYKSHKLALSSICNDGNKTITNTLIDFLKGWYFYDFQPDVIRGSFLSLPFGMDPVMPVQPQWFRIPPKLNEEGLTLSNLLISLHEKEKELFTNVNESLIASTDFHIVCNINDEKSNIYLVDGNENRIPLERASDGTLRLLAYYILLNQPELPSLIGIEEPEQSLHPGALKDIANVLEQLAERTQVIITTHSSQLLDNFDSDRLSDSLGVLLLRNRSGLGTEVLNLEEIKDKREALDGWIADFGIGSAIFDSELLQDLMEEPI